MSLVACLKLHLVQGMGYDQICICMEWRNYCLTCWCYYYCYLANLYVYIWHWFIPIWKKNDIIILAFYTLLMPLELYPSNVFVMILLLSFVIITWQYISFITYLATAAKICPYLELCWVQVSMWDSYTNIETIVQEIIDR